MARAVLTIDVGAMGEVRQRIEFGIEELDDYSEMWPLVKQDYHDTRREAFATQGASLGTPWPGYQLSERQYVAIKGSVTGVRITDAHQLRWPGGQERLFPSYTGGAEGVYRAAALSLALGSSVPYAFNHEYGIGTAPQHLGGHAIPIRQVGAVLGRPMEERLGARLGDLAAKVGRKIDIKSADVSMMLGRMSGGGL